MKSMSPALTFLSNEAGEEEGLGHAGIETYKDAPYASVARECGQNSADAGLHVPVLMQFDLLTIQAADYPPHTEQVEAVDSCLLKARAKKDDKQVDFFERAKEVLAAGSIKILTIADQNTKGLVGPAQPGTPFHSLVKASGVSNKDSDASGGSFGIGKNAAFAVSELQTVFYSTVYRDQETGAGHFLAQGKTILISHSDHAGKSLRATAYWGLPSFRPIENKEDVPTWLRRDEIGTTVSVMGFRESENWQYRIAASLLQNFFCAIYKGAIRFLINQGQIDISRSTIPELFSDPLICKAADDSDQREDFDFSRDLFECLISADATRTDLNIDGLGRVSLIMLMREKLPKRVCIVRNGMSITDNLANFGDKFASFPLYREFVALVEPMDVMGSALIKRLENPRHDGLSAERLSDARKRADATRIMKKLARAIREAIKERALPKPEAQFLLDELSEFFSDVDQSDRPPQPGIEEDPETYKYEPATKRTRTPLSDVTGKLARDGGAGGTKPGSGAGGGGRGSGAGGGKGGKSRTSGAEPIVIDEFRNRLAPREGKWHRRLLFTPGDSGKALLELTAVGLDTPEPLRVVSADRGVASGGRVLLDLEAGTRCTVNVAFSERYEGPIELVASRSPVAGTSNEN